MNLTDNLVTLACRVKRGGVILNYHTLTPQQLSEQIELWAPHFDFIHHDDLGRRLASPGSKPFCLVTFDDGKKSHLTRVAPVLARYGVPAAFYIVTKFTSGELPVLWFDAYRAFVRDRGECPRGLESPALKRLPNAERLALLEGVYRMYGFRARLDDEDAAALSWDDVRELHRQGHAIGAHSETHAILTTLPEAEAKAEIERSIARVGEELGRPCASFAFPNGNHTAELARHAMRCGVRTVMTTDPAWMGSCEQPWRLPRVQLYTTRTARWHQLKVFVASLGWLLANPDGTGRKYIGWRRKTRAGAKPAWGSVPLESEPRA